jgi:hypothetical protein
VRSVWLVRAGLWDRIWCTHSRDPWYAFQLMASMAECVRAHLQPCWRTVVGAAHRNEPSRLSMNCRVLDSHCPLSSFSVLPHQQAPFPRPCSLYIRASPWTETVRCSQIMASQSSPLTWALQKDPPRALAAPASLQTFPREKT